MDQTMRERGRVFELLVRVAMTSAGIDSIEELADRAYISRLTWYRWFKGYEPKRSSVAAAAPVLGLSVEELMDPCENGPRMVTLTEERWSALIRDAIAEGGSRPSDDSAPSALGISLRNPPLLIPPGQTKSRRSQGG